MKNRSLETKYVILGKIKEAESLIPGSYIHDLMPTELIKSIPAWHDFERGIWKIGEEIRLLLLGVPSLREDQDILAGVVSIAVNRNAKRGRQSFIMLLGYKFCRHYAQDISSQLDDPFVDGQVILTLRKMYAEGYADRIRPFLDSPVTWVRNEAKKYLARFGDS